MFNIVNMMKQFQDMQGKMQQVQDELKNLEVEGQAGAGLVTVRMTGQNDVKKVEIDASLLTEDKMVLEDLVAAAVNDAVKRAEEAKAKKMGELTEGLNMPPGFKMPF